MQPFLTALIIYWGQTLYSCQNYNIDIIYYTTSNNVCNDYLTNKKFGGIYTKENVFFKKEEVLDFLLQKFKNRE